MMPKLSELLTNPLPWDTFVPVAASSSQSYSSPSGGAQAAASLNGGQPIWNNNLTVAPVQNVNATQINGGGGGYASGPSQGISAESPAMQYADAMNNARLAQEAGPSLGHTGYSGIPTTLGDSGGYLGTNQGIANTNYQNANAAYAQNPNAATASAVAAAQAQNNFWGAQNANSVSQNQSFIGSTLAQPQTYGGGASGGVSGGGVSVGEQGIGVVPATPNEPPNYGTGVGYNSPGMLTQNYGTPADSYSGANVNVGNQPYGSNEGPPSFWQDVPQATSMLYPGGPGVSLSPNAVTYNDQGGMVYPNGTVYDPVSNAQGASSYYGGNTQQGSGYGDGNYGGYSAGYGGGYGQGFGGDE